MLNEPLLLNMPPPSIAELLLIVQRVIVIDPSLRMPPAGLSPAVLFEIVLSTTDIVPVLVMAVLVLFAITHRFIVICELLLIASTEFAIVRSEIEIASVFVLAINTPEEDEFIVSAFAPGPLIERLTSIVICPLVKVMLVTPPANWITSPLEASLTACRKDPGPLSLPFVTVMVAAGVSVVPNKSVEIRQAR